MDLPHVEVRKTNIGNALFANKRFRTGQEIGIIEGQVINDPEYGSQYCVAVDPSTSIEPFAPFRFLNHCCEPNCELVTWDPEDPTAPRLALHAIRSIKAGDELTIDYAWPADAAINCLCGSVKCRGWVVAASELKLLIGSQTKSDLQTKSELKTKPEPKSKRSRGRRPANANSAS